MLTCLKCGATHPEGTPVCPEDGGALLAEAASPTGDPRLAPGTMVGEYRVEQRLGAGTFGEVYAGEQPLIRKRVAIKLLRRKFASDPEVVSRFIAEARAVNQIRHPNIVDIFSFGMYADARHDFVMDLLEGMTLSALLARDGRLSVSRALPILRGIADALDAAHQAGITHRDLKPDNVFLAIQKDGSYSPRLLDFGIAKLCGDDIAHRTATGVALGTPRYMSPEQCHGKKVDHRADIYALGVVIHEMLTGQLLFRAESSLELFMKHTSEPPEPMSRVCADLPPALDAPVLVMLAKRADARPSSAGRAVAALAERARAGGATDPARPASTTEDVPSPTASDPAAASSDERALARIEAATVREVKSPRAAVLPSTAPARSSAGDSAAVQTPAPPPRPEAGLAPRPRSPWTLIGATVVVVALSAIALAESGAGRGVPEASSGPGRSVPEASSGVVPGPSVAPAAVSAALGPDAAAPGPSAQASAPSPVPPSSVRPRAPTVPRKPAIHGNIRAAVRVRAPVSEAP